MIRPMPVVIPGDSTVVSALGYLHANCSHCHNATRPDRDGPRCFDPQNGYDFSLAVGSLASTAATATYRTAIGSAVRSPSKTRRASIC